MGKFLFGVIVGLAILPLAVYVYFAKGIAQVATSAPPMPSPTQMWQLSLLVAHADQPPASAKAMLASPVPAAPTAQPAPKT